MNYYTITVAVKPYIRAFLENNFGSPVDIRKDPELNNMVEFLLKEGATRLDKTLQIKYTASGYQGTPFTGTASLSRRRPRSDLIVTWNAGSNFSLVFTSLTTGVSGSLWPDVSVIFKKNSISRKTSGVPRPFEKTSRETVKPSSRNSSRTLKTN